MRERGGRPPGGQPGGGRAHRRPAQRPREPPRQDHLGRRPPGLRPQDHHGARRVLQHHPPVRRPLGFPVSRRIRARRRRHRPRLDVDQLWPGPRRGGEAERPERRPRRLRAGRRRAHGRRRLRGHEPGRPAPHAARRRAERQPDVDQAQRGRLPALPESLPPRPRSHPPARGHGTQHRPHPGHRRARLQPGQGRQGEHEGLPWTGSHLRGARLRLYRCGERSRHRRAAPRHPAGDRHRAAGARARAHGERQGLRARRGAAGRVPRHRPVRACQRRAQGGGARLDLHGGLRQGHGARGAARPARRGDHRGDDAGHRPRGLRGRVPAASLRRRHRRGARRRLRRRPRPGRHAAGGGGVLDLPATRLRHARAGRRAATHPGRLRARQGRPGRRRRTHAPRCVRPLVPAPHPAASSSWRRRATPSCST